jgi:hypothetical protein
MDREQQAFQCGFLFGVMAVALEMQPRLAEIDDRLHRLEEEFRPRPRPRVVFVPAGWRCGERVYHVRLA